MKAAPFDYVRPETVADVLSALTAADGRAKLIAGGQSLVPLLALRMAAPSLLVDISRVTELRGIEIGPSGTRIGALTRWREIERDAALRVAQPLLATAVKHVAHYQIRTRGTIGGSCAHADPASEMPAVTLACSATFEIVSARGRRWVPAEEFYLGALTTAIEEDELLVAVHLPPWPPGRRFAFQEFSRRSGDFALVGCLAFCDVDGDGRCRNVRFGAFGIDERPRRLIDVEDVLAERHLTPSLAAEAAAVASHVVSPQSDLHAPADYRRALLQVLAERALLELRLHPDRLAA